MKAKVSCYRKQMLGNRASNSDGFTYPYGRFPFNYNTRSADIKRQIRADKRSVKAKEDKLIYDEEIKELL